MKLKYTKEELAVEVTALEQVFDQVQIVDPYRGALLDPVTLEPGEECGSVPMLDDGGRGLQFDQTKCASTRASGGGSPCVLLVHFRIPHDSNVSAGAQNSYDRAMAQYQDDMRRDYITGVYNARYIQEEYRSYAEKQAMQGKPVGAVMLRVNEYWNLRDKESEQAAECCLNTAAGILQLAVGTDRDHAVLARLEDGLFVAITWACRRPGWPRPSRRRWNLPARCSASRWHGGAPSR